MDERDAHMADSHICHTMQNEGQCDPYATLHLRTSPTLYTITDGPIRSAIPIGQFYCPRSPDVRCHSRTWTPPMSSLYLHRLS